MRPTALWAAILATCCAFVLAQQAALKPNAPFLSEGPSPEQLIAWSNLQTPRPIAPTPAIPSAGEAQSQSQDPSPARKTQAQPAAESFNGTIVRDGLKFVLKGHDGTVYQLDDPGESADYESMQVRVEGSLDPRTNTLHVAGIELLS